MEITVQHLPGTTEKVVTFKRTTTPMVSVQFRMGVDVTGRYWASKEGTHTCTFLHNSPTKLVDMVHAAAMSTLAPDETTLLCEAIDGLEAFQGYSVAHRYN